MSGSALGHRLVQDYLTRLEACLRGAVPAAQGRELKDQIAAHLDEALPPDADDQQVAETLSRLGSPEVLAAEAGAAAGPRVGEAVSGAARRIRARVAGARTRTKVLAGLIALLLAAGTAWPAVFLTTSLIQWDGASGWWYSQDYLHEVDTHADGAMQTTVPIRSGQRQGFAIGITNTSNFTETIVGGGLNPPSQHPYYGLFGPEQIGVSVPNRDTDYGGGFIRNVAFTLPGSIPPHQFRILRITWISTACLEGKSAEIADRLYLRVRVGWFTRTDVIALGQGWALAGPSHNPDTQPGPNHNLCV